MLAGPRRIPLGQIVELAIQEGSPDLHEAAGTRAAPAHLLALAHAASDDAIDRRFHVASRDPSTNLLPASVVDQRAEIRSEIEEHIEQLVERAPSALTEPSGIALLSQ